MVKILVLSRYVLLDAQRGGLHWIFTCTALAATALGWFLAQLSVTEKLDIQIVTTASILRLAFMFIAAVWVCAHIIREKQDQTIDLLLTLPLRRSDFVLGKLLAFCAISLIAATIAMIPLSVITFDRYLVMWAGSLSLELWLVCGCALLCAVGMKNVTSSFAVVTAFYLLSRSISAMVLMANTTVPNSPNILDLTIAWFVNTVAYILPPLDQFTNSAWLIHHTIPVASWTELLLQALIYTLLLGVVTIWDIEHKPL